MERGELEPVAQRIREYPTVEATVVLKGPKGDDFEIVVTAKEGGQEHRVTTFEEFNLWAFEQGIALHEIQGLQGDRTLTGTLGRTQSGRLLNIVERSMYLPGARLTRILSLVLALGLGVVVCGNPALFVSVSVIVIISINSLASIQPACQSVLAMRSDERTGLAGLAEADWLVPFGRAGFWGAWGAFGLIVSVIFLDVILMLFHLSSIPFVGPVAMIVAIFQVAINSALACEKYITSPVSRYLRNVGRSDIDQCREWLHTTRNEVVILYVLSLLAVGASATCVALAFRNLDTLGFNLVVLVLGQLGVAMGQGALGTLSARVIEYVLRASQRFIRERGTLVSLGQQYTRLISLRRSIFGMTCAVVLCVFGVLILLELHGSLTPWSALAILIGACIAVCLILNGAPNELLQLTTSAEAGPGRLIPPLSGNGDTEAGTNEPTNQTPEQ